MVKLDPNERPEGICRDCRYFTRYLTSNDEPSGNGACRRHPPGDKMWITICEDEYCWEFEKQRTGKNPATVKKRAGRFDTLEG